jgi:hypothetical protein
MRRRSLHQIENRYEKKSQQNAIAYITQFFFLKRELYSRILAVWPKDNETVSGGHRGTKLKAANIANKITKRGRMPLKLG